MQTKKSTLAIYIWMQFCLLVHHSYIDRPGFDSLFSITVFVMIASTVLVYLLLAVSSGASQETINVVVLQSDGDQCPPADQLEAVRSNVTEMIRAFIKTNLLSAGSFQNPATSCVNLPQSSPPGNYWILNPSTGNATLQYCDNSTRCSCGEGGWMRVANLDMTEQTQQCPLGFRSVESTYGHMV